MVLSTVVPNSAFQTYYCITYYGFFKLGGGGGGKTIMFATPIFSWEGGAGQDRRL